MRRFWNSLGTGVGQFPSWSSYRSMEEQDRWHEYGRTIPGSSNHGLASGGIIAGPAKVFMDGEAEAMGVGKKFLMQYESQMIEPDLQKWVTDVKDAIIKPGPYTVTMDDVQINEDGMKIIFGHDLSPLQLLDQQVERVCALAR